MKEILNQQDALLNAVRREGTHVTIYLVSGLPLKGIIKGFDNFTIMLDNEGRQCMVYKHAISTITPQVRVNLLAEKERGNE